MIRRATLLDAPALAALGRRTFVDAFGADNTAADLEAFLASTYADELQRRELLDDSRICLVAEHDGQLVAFALLNTGKRSAFVSDPTALELQRFYLDRSVQGTGLAQALMAACVDAARERGGKTLFLGVWERNARALRFYAAQGFRQVGDQIFHVGSDPQRDLVLARSLQPT